MSVLEEISARSPDAFLARLGHTLHYPVLGMEALNELAPAFDLLPFADALRRECVALRNAEGEVLMGFADPFQPDFQEWVEARVPGPVKWCLVHQADLTAYLARHEETMRAMEGVLSAAREGGREARGMEDLSLRMISEDTSPVVKLVHSTLYDALKLVASGR